MRPPTIGLIVSLLIYYSEARNCILEGGEYNEGINIYSKADDNADEFLTINTQNVKSVNPIIQDSNYVEVSYTDDIMIFKPSQEFRTYYEKNTAYTANPRVMGRIQLTCTDDDTYEIDYYQSINDLNTFEPFFDKPTYEFYLTMPIASGVDLTIFGEDFFVTDYDVTNERIDFTINGESSDLFEIVWEGRVSDSETKGKMHKGVLRTTSVLRLTKDTTFTITATDTGLPNVKTATAIITIRIDESTIVPPCPSFDKGFYQASYDITNPDIHFITNTPIRVSEGVDKIELIGDYAHHFQLTVGEDNLMNISLISNLPNDVITLQPFVALSITASIDKAEASATTSLIVTLPQNLCIR